MLEAMAQARALRLVAVTAFSLAGLLAATPAQAQPAPEEMQPPPPPPPMAEPMAPPPPMVMPPPPPPMVIGPDGQPIMLAPQRPPPPPPFVAHRFRGGQALYGVGTAFGLIGSGLSLASIFVSSVYGFAPNGQNVDIGPDLAYAGSAATGAGFILSATGLGLQHSALRAINADPGRGLYGVGTAFGILGLAGVGASYLFGLTNYVPNSSVVGFGCSIASAVVLSVGGLFFFSDATRLGRVYRRLTTF